MLLRSELLGEQQMKINKNNCLVIDGTMVRFTKVMRNAIVWVRWGNGELPVVSQQGELVAQYAYPFEGRGDVSGFKERDQEIPEPFNRGLVSPMSSYSFVTDVSRHDIFNFISSGYRR